MIAIAAIFPMTSSPTPPGEQFSPDIDPRRHRVMTTMGEWSAPSPRPWRAFIFLRRHYGEPVTIGRLVPAVWPSRMPDGESAFRQLILELRQALRGTKVAGAYLEVGRPAAYELAATSKTEGGA